MPSKIPIASTVRAAVLAELAQGRSYEAVAGDHGLNTHLVKRVAREAGLVKPRAPRSQLSADKRESITRLARLGVSTAEISRRLGTSPRTVVGVVGSVEVARG